jgi:uncharacterized protein YndB with AHSA1/START domain
MEKAQVLIERTYDASPSRVWRAITDPTQMQQWYLPVHEFRPEPGFETSFEQHVENKVFPHVWKVTEVVPGEKISYEWRLKGFPGSSRVTFELTPDGEGTRLKVLHTGLETFRGDVNPDLHPRNIQEGWDHFINDSLTTFLQKGPAQVIMERTYNAPVEKVWQAITNVDQMKQWYMPLTDFRPEPGFTTSFDINAKGRDFRHIWKVAEVIPNKKISYEWRYGGFPGNSLVTFELIPRGRTTTLKLTHIGLETFEGYRNEGLKPENFEKGWTSLLGTMLPQFLEKEHAAVG